MFCVLAKCDNQTVILRHEPVATISVYARIVLASMAPGGINCWLNIPQELLWLFILFWNNNPHMRQCTCPSEQESVSQSQTI